MESGMIAKQTYLREQILDKGYDPSQFIVYLDSKLSIGDDLTLCSFEQLSNVVQSFIALKRQPSEQKDQQTEPPQESIIPVIASEEMTKSVVQKPKNIFFQKYNFVEPQFSKNYQCIKIRDQYSKIKGLKCQVFNPTRKNTGGFFGIGGTSFLEFQVKTNELNWLVGRRYSDFQWLRSYLLKTYPTQIIPPIPQKKASKRTQRHVQKRMRILEYFLNDLVNIPQFINNKYVQGFLRLSDLSKFQQLKDESEKVKPFNSISSVETASGEVNVRLSEQNDSYKNEMKRFIPEVERIYKQITRQSKALQALQTQEVNTLYQIGNLFAQLHERSREILNKLPKSKGLKQLNQIYITLNNMMIEWGNIVRNQFQFLEKNLNTFFKYVRNQLHGYNQIFTNQEQAQQQFAKLRISLDKKKEKIYNLFDFSKWQLPKQVISSLPKDILHNKAEAFKVMLPKENLELEKLRARDYLYISQLHVNGDFNFSRCCSKFCQNFKQFAIKIKVNTQQLSQLWLEMGANFSGQTKVQCLKQKPEKIDTGDEIVDD